MWGQLKCTPLPCHPHFHSDSGMGHQGLHTGDKGIRGAASCSERQDYAHLPPHQTCQSEQPCRACFPLPEKMNENPQTGIQTALIEATHSSDGSAWAGAVCGSKSTD